MRSTSNEPAEHVDTAKPKFSARHTRKVAEKTPKKETPAERRRDRAAPKRGQKQMAQVEIFAQDSAAPSILAIKDTPAGARQPLPVAVPPRYPSVRNYVPSRKRCSSPELGRGFSKSIDETRNARTLSTSGSGMHKHPRSGT